MNPLMNPVQRRKFIATTGRALAASMIGPWIGRARAAEFIYKVGTDLPGTHPLNLRLQQAADAIKKDSDGRMEIKIFPDNQLGGDPDMFSQLRAGALEFFTLSGVNVLSTLVPKTAISGVGFAFKDSTQVFQALDGDLGKLLRGHITKAGLVVQDKSWDNGFRQITSSTRAIKTPADLAAFKIRVPIAKLYTSLFQALGAAPTGLSWNEVYTALQTRVVDGQENALLVASVSKLYEVQKFCSITNHVWDGFWLLGNRKAWDRLPPNVQQIFSKHMNDYALLQRQDVQNLNSSIKSQLEEKGLIFNSTDPQAFRAALSQAGYYAEWKRSFGEEEWSLLEKVTGKLA